MSVRDPAFEASGPPLRRRAAVVATPATGPRGAVAVAGLLVSGVLVAVTAARTTSFLPESVRPVPASLAGAFRTIAFNLHPLGAIGVLVLMFASYALAAARPTRISARTAVAAIVALHVFVVLAPPLFSTDVFSYQAYARMGAHYGINPYLNSPRSIQLDQLYPYVGAKWTNIPSAYGPAFTAFSYALSSVSIALSVVVYKVIAALASLGLVAVVWRCALLRGLDPVRAAVLVGLNPLVVVYGVGGGHNDLLMLLAMAGSLWALLSARPRTAGGLGVLAIGVKLTAALMLPFALADGGPPIGRERRRALLAGVGIGLVLVAALSFAVFGSGTFHLLNTVRQSQSDGDWKSIPGAIGDRLHLPTIGHIVGYLLAAAFAGVAAWLLVRVWRGVIDWVDAAGWATVAMLIASSSFLPWYVAWMLPFAAVTRDHRLRVAAIGLTGVVQLIQLLGYIPHGLPLV